MIQNTYKYDIYLLNSPTYQFFQPPLRSWMFLVPIGFKSFFGGRDNDALKVENEELRREMTELKQQQARPVFWAVSHSDTQLGDAPFFFWNVSGLKWAENLEGVQVHPSKVLMIGKKTLVLKTPQPILRCFQNRWGSQRLDPGTADDSLRQTVGHHAGLGQ